MTKSFSKRKNLALAALSVLMAVCLAVTLCGFFTAKAEDAKTFDFTSMDSAALDRDFNAYYAPNSEAGGWDTMNADELGNWTLGSNGITSKTYKETGGNPYENGSYLAYDSDKYLQYFEASVTFTIGADNDNSYTGIFFGLNNFEKSPKTSSNNGAQIYVTNWGHLYIEGFLFNNTKGTAQTFPQDSAQWDTDKYKNDANAAGDRFGDHEYWGNTDQKSKQHTLRVRVTENKIEAVLDPDGEYARSLTYTFTDGSGITFGQVGLYATNQPSTFASFSVKELNADGTDKTEADTGIKHYSFTDDAATEALFDSYFAPSDGNDWATYPRGFTDNWAVGAAGILSNKATASSETSLRNMDSLVISGIDYDYFEISTVVKFSSWSGFAGGNYQTVGFAFGWNDFTRRADYGENAGGGIAYLNNDGHLNIAANTVLTSEQAAEKQGSVAGSGSPSIAWDNDNQVVRNVADGSVNAWSGRENWNVAHTLKLRVVANKIELILDEGTTLERSVSYTFNDGVDGISAGAIGIFASNGSVSFLNGIDVQYLDESGNKISPVEVTGIDIGEVSQTQQVNTSLTLSPAVSPANATNKSYTLTSSDTSVAEIVNNVVLFVGKGEVTITATSSFNTNIQDSVTVTVEDRDVSSSLYIDLTDDETVAKLQPYYQAGGNSSDHAQEEELAAHWALSNGVITRQNDLGSSVSENYAELYFNREFQSFEISYLMKADSAAGWAGVMYGKTNYATFFDQGDGAYIATHDRKATYWGQSIGAYSDAGNESVAENYRIGEWNLIKLQVYGTSAGRTVKMFVNDMTQPVLSRTQAVATAQGKVCLFATSNAVSFKEITINYLTENGEAIPYVATQSVSITNKITQANTGSSYTIEAVSAPANGTNTGISYSSSDPSVASVTDAGVINFLSAGTVTISAVSQDDPSIADSMTITVSIPAIQALSISNKVSTANIGDTFTLQVTRTPADAVGSYTFKSSDESVATVTATGIVNFIGAGTVTITVQSSNDESVSDTMTVVVSSPVEGGLPLGAIIGIVAAAVVLAAAAIVVTAVVIRRKKSAGRNE